jgi:hypothetical protein
MGVLNERPLPVGRHGLAFAAVGKDGDATISRIGAGQLGINGKAIQTSFTLQDGTEVDLAGLLARLDWLEKYVLALKENSRQLSEIGLAARVERLEKYVDGETRPAQQTKGVAS